MRAPEFRWYIWKPPPGYRADSFRFGFKKGDFYQNQRQHNCIIHITLRILVYWVMLYIYILFGECECSCDGLLIMLAISLWAVQYTTWQYRTVAKYRVDWVNLNRSASPHINPMASTRIAVGYHSIEWALAQRTHVHPVKDISFFSTPFHLPHWHKLLQNANPAT